MDMVKIELVKGFELKNDTVEPALVRINSVFGSGWETVEVVNRIVANMEFAPLWFAKYDDDGGILFHVSNKFAEKPEMITEIFKVIHDELEKEYRLRQSASGTRANFVEAANAKLRRTLEEL